MFLELIKNLTNGIDVIYFISADQDIIQVENHNNVQLLGKNLVDIALETDWNIRQAKQYYLILKIIVLGLESHLLFAFFMNPYLLVGTGQFELCKAFSQT